jgi:metal-responsive CopG/Arc/MetJ family transcriptional regulator
MATELASSHIAFDDDSTEALDVRLTFTLGRSLADRIADYRFGRRISSESAAIRQLIIAGLKSEAWRNKKPL